MNEVGFRRELFDFLRTGYGVTDAAVEGGGKHCALVFTRPNGPRIKTTWPRKPVGGLDWRRTLEVKTRDLVGMLGEPAAPTPRARVRMEDLMPTSAPMADQIRAVLPSLAAQLDHPPVEPAAPPPEAVKTVLSGWSIACYVSKNTSCLRAYLPNGDRPRLGDHATATEVEPGVYRLAPSRTGRQLHDYGPSRQQLQWSVGFREAFGTSPCEATAEGDGVVVRVPASDARAALNPNFGRRRAAAPVVPASKGGLANPPELPTTASGARWVEPTTPPTADDIRAALAAIRRIEAETPYRLLRDGDAWVFDPGLARIV